MAKLFAWIIGCGTLIILASMFLGVCNDTSQVVQKEFNASALLKKYEYFKDESSAIDKKRADIMVYESELSSYHPHSTNKDDKFYYEQRKSEMIGLISIYNSLCADYNSQMSKFNYRFTNKGDLPESNLEPLPREYKPYILNIKQNSK